MPSKILKWGLLAIVLAGCVVLLFQYARRGPSNELSSKPETIGLPARIKIPIINIDAAIEEVGLTTDGSMDVPKLPLDTGWYKFGPRPGRIGSAVIAGHVDWKNGAPAVFADLRNLKPGDKVVVQDDQGTVISFVVRTSRTYDSNAYASDVFTSNDGKAHLNLITCKGVWDKVAKDYPQRLVIFTDKEIK